MAKLKRGQSVFSCAIPPRRRGRQAEKRPKTTRVWLRRNEKGNSEPSPSLSSLRSDLHGYSEQNKAIVGYTTGSDFYVRIPSIVDVLPPELSQSERPYVTFDDILGCDYQKQEIRKAVELPLKCHELYKRMGIDRPRGVLLFGPPGTGKTMLANAIANRTDAAFIRVVGSEFVQKYLDEGPQMVRDVFQLAKENTPAVIFIDEVDAIATARFDVQTEPDKKVHRILMELLKQMDVLDQTVNVNLIMATNRADTLEPALLHRGWLGRKIEFTLPDRQQKALVFRVCTAKMNVSDQVELEEYVSRLDNISAAEIVAICREAGQECYSGPEEPECYTPRALLRRATELMSPKVEG